MAAAEIAHHVKGRTAGNIDTAALRCLIRILIGLGISAVIGNLAALEVHRSAGRKINAAAHCIGLKVCGLLISTNRVMRNLTAEHIEGCVFININAAAAGNRISRIIKYLCAAASNAPCSILAYLSAHESESCAGSNINAAAVCLFNGRVISLEIVAVNTVVTDIMCPAFSTQIGPLITIRCRSVFHDAISISPLIGTKTCQTDAEISNALIDRRIYDIIVIGRITNLSLAVNRTGTAGYHTDLGTCIGGMFINNSQFTSDDKDRGLIRGVTRKRIFVGVKTGDLVAIEVYADLNALFDAKHSIIIFRQGSEVDRVTRAGAEGIVTCRTDHELLLNSIELLKTVLILLDFIKALTLKIVVQVSPGIFTGLCYLEHVLIGVRAYRRRCIKGIIISAISRAGSSEKFIYAELRVIALLPA